MYPALFAGHETTTLLIGNGVLYSMQNREQERLLTPTMAGSAIEEWLRYDGPSGAFARVAAADLEMSGRTIREGQRVFAFMNAANRDPAAFDDPDFDVGRAPNPHMTFGHGIHFCLGAPLAQLEWRSPRPDWPSACRRSGSRAASRNGTIR